MKRKDVWNESMRVRVTMSRHFVKRVAERFSLHEPGDESRNWGFSRAKKHGKKLLKAAKEVKAHRDGHRLRISFEGDHERYLQAGTWIIPVARHRKVEGLWVAVTIYDVGGT